MIRTFDTFPAGTGLGSPDWYDDQIMAHDAFSHWFRPEPSDVTFDVNRRISQMSDRAGTSAAFLQATDANKPSLVARGINGFTAARLDGSNDHLALGNNDVNFNAPWSVVAIFKPTNFASARYVWSNFTDSDDRSYLTIGTDGNASIVHGTSLTPGVAVQAGEWNLSIGSFDGTSIFARTNGIETSSTASGSGGDGSFIYGALNAASGYFLGDMADLLTFSGSVFDYPDLIRLIEAFAADTYAIEIA